ncbi:hypothetical protein Sme01_16830 [Sphaerisporangium melleum]|uniref:Extradiol ring-cleavage dioxygenase class III enzyme subunit B domain-containing protein n=1 Tax=Sphaerisporangium melleum TaxID=321316 RepID=A0A917VHG4_9ACTN|nr:hypothetical protein [Sphaerisporangium melleum]GGK82802.1 hypothetical protein GCM10007964_26770 [Sphaerisporangium melleum]GII69207.1 hypothetical protein Sme01_16830 [Sphaerisporangium melleum]
MLVAAAVCPHPPLIAPELAGAAAAELDDLRDACVAAVRSLAEARPDTLIVLGAAEGLAQDAVWHGPDAAGSLAPWGVDVRAGKGEPVLPLSLTVGRLLVDLAGIDPPAGYVAVASDATPAACARLGAELAGQASRVALLVMGDGSAKLTVKSPGYHDPRARDHDDALARALGGADAVALAALDPGEAAELWVAGRAAFQTLAGAAAAHGERGERGAEDERATAPGAGGPEAGGRYRGELLYADAPYGVGYLVARWSLV